MANDEEDPFEGVDWPHLDKVLTTALAKALMAASVPSTAAFTRAVPMTLARIAARIMRDNGNEQGFIMESLMRAVAFEAGVEVAGIVQVERENVAPTAPRDQPN